MTLHSLRIVISLIHDSVGADLIDSRNAPCCQDLTSLLKFAREKRRLGFEQFELVAEMASKQKGVASQARRVSVHTYGAVGHGHCRAPGDNVMAASPEPQLSTRGNRSTGSTGGSGSTETASSVQSSSSLGAPVRGLALAPEGALEAATSQRHVDTPHPTWAMRRELTSTQASSTGASPEDGLWASTPPSPEQASA